MSDARKISFLATTNSKRPTDLMPYLPLKLERGGKSIDVLGLVDSGASINVLPYTIGLELGAIWEEQTTFFKLSGNLANQEARGLLLRAKIADFPPINLAFGWTESDDMPVILGQINFFTTFDIFFYGSQYEFEIKTR